MFLLDSNIICRLHNVPGAHYESASTRKFLHGRTETIRSCSIESVHFAKTMLNKSATDEEKKAAMTEAINSHKNYAIEVSCSFEFKITMFFLTFHEINV